MRISGGTLKNRRFYPPVKKWPTRPTTDIAREALFNILSNILDFERTGFLDLFGGSGAHSYEMISRGCKNVVYVDNFPACLKFVKKTAIEFQIESEIEFVLSDFEYYLRTTTKKFEYIFAGPPYQLKNLSSIPDLIFQNKLLVDKGLFVLEHNPKYIFSEHSHFLQVRHYGQTYFSFFN